jgi:hypothetical protein
LVASVTLRDAERFGAKKKKRFSLTFFGAKKEAKFRVP